VDSCVIAFDSGVRYKGVLKWDTVIEQKALELGRYLVGKSRFLNFSEPSPTLERSDSRELRGKILALAQSEAKRRGIGKSTLHYLRKNATNERSFTVYRKIRKRLEYFRIG